MFITSEKQSLHLPKIKFSAKSYQAHHYILMAGPIVALAGHTVSDAWLILVTLTFLAYSVQNNSWAWTGHKWFKVAFAFWLWLMFVSAISDWPGNALSQAVTWIRFPVFAAALMVWLGQSETLRQRMFGAIFFAVLIMAVVLVVERMQNPGVIRLYGTWSQAPKAGWYMLGMGLPILLWSLMKLKEDVSNVLWALPLTLFIFGASIGTGEIYINMSLVFACSLFILFSRFWSWSVLLVGGLCAAAGVGVLLTNGDLFYRFTAEVLERLPWLESSDYFDAWFGGFNAGLLNPLMGVGADNYEDYCKSLMANDTVYLLGVGRCLSHPHNIYIQTFAETGIIGLALFISLCVTLFRTARAGSPLLKMTPTTALSLAIIVLVVWPVSTYSQAFGQHKNFFTWFLIGWALCFAYAAHLQRYRE